MGISRKADYALRLMVELIAEGGGPVSTRVLADKADAPYAFIAKIVAELAGRGFVELSRGRGGGVKLTIDPHRTSALQVLEAVSGSLQVNECVDDPSSCLRSGFCALCDAFSDAQQRMREALSVDLATLAKTQERKLAAVGG